MRQFRDLTCSQFQTLEIPRETAARHRRQMKAQATAGQVHSLSTSNSASAASEPTALPQPPISAQMSSSSHSQPQPPSGPSSKIKQLNLFTVKFHFLGDYVHHIRLFGTTDSYSTQLVCFSSRFYYPNNVSESSIHLLGRACPPNCEAALWPHKQEECDPTNQQEVLPSASLSPHRRARRKRGQPGHLGRSSW